MTESTTDYDPVVIEGKWLIGQEQIGFVRMEFHPTWVEWCVLHLNNASQRQGVFKYMVEHMPALFASWGVEVMVATADNEVTQAALENFGYQLGEWEGVERMLSHTVGGRMAEYRAWLLGGPKPEWHGGH